MDRSITKKSLWGFLFFLMSFLTFSEVLNAQSCPIPTGTHETNISNFDATVNWSYDTSNIYYRIRYKEINSNNWINRNNIFNNNKDLHNLNAGSFYVWQVKGYCDTLNNLSSQWSVLDTFETTNYALDCNGVL